MADLALKILSNADARLMRDILARWRPDLLPILEATSLTEDQREDLRSAVAEELVMHGVDHSDWEPTRYGLRLESLIDKIGHIASVRE